MEEYICLVLFTALKEKINERITANTSMVFLIKNLTIEFNGGSIKNLKFKTHISDINKEIVAKLCKRKTNIDAFMKFKDSNNNINTIDIGGFLQECADDNNSDDGTTFLFINKI